MTSQFAYAIHQKRHELIEELVSHLLQVQPEDENYGLARDFCLQKAYYNSFPDVHSGATEEYYAELVAGLEADSQLTKAAALSALTSKLLALKLESSAGVQDLNHNLLQLLASLSGQPLSSSLELSQDVLDMLYQPSATALADDAPEQQQQHQQAMQPAGLNRFQRLLKQAAGRAGSAQGASSTAGSDDGSDYDPYGDDSSLSDWDADPKQQQQQLQQQPSAIQDPSTEQDQEQQQEQDHEQQQQEQQVTAVKPGGLYSAAQARWLRVPALPPGCVVPTAGDALAKLAALYGTSLSLRQQHKLQFCFSPAFLAEQVLRVLQGLPAHGFVIQDPRSKPASGGTQGAQQQHQGSSSDGGGGGDSGSRLGSGQCFAVDPRVMTPGMSPTALHALLSEAAAAGTCARQLRALVQQLAYSRTLGDFVPVTPCLRALGVALQQQLDLMAVSLADLMQQQQQQQQQQQPEGLLLLLIRQHIRAASRRLLLLHSNVFEVVVSLEKERTPAAVSAGLIDGLAASVRAAANKGSTGPAGAAGAAALLHLLLSSCVPLARALARWLWAAADGLDAAGTTPAAPAPAAAAAAGGGGGKSSSKGAASQQQEGVCVGDSVCSQDFFILRQAGQDIAAVDPRFWHSAYGFCQHAGPEGDAGVGCGGVCCPVFLLPFVDIIMTAGKSMRLLDHMEQEELKCSNICSATTATNTRGRSSGSSSSAQGVAAGAMQVGGGMLMQQLRPGSAPAAAAGPALLLPHHHQPSTPRRRRPSSAGGARLGSSSAAAGGRVSRRPSITARPGSSSIIHSHTATAGAAAGNSRKKWASAEATAQQEPAPPAAAASAAVGSVGAAAAVSRRVRLQLAAAAAAAGRRDQQELPAEFISTACYVLQQEQQLQARAAAQTALHQHSLRAAGSSSSTTTAAAAAAAAAGGVGVGSESSLGYAAGVLTQRLKGVASWLSRPHDMMLGHTGDCRPAVQQHNLMSTIVEEEEQHLTLRQQLAAKQRLARMAAQSLGDPLLGDTEQQQQQQQAAVAEAAEGGSEGSPAAPSTPTAPGHPAPHSSPPGTAAPQAQATTAGGPTAAAAAEVAEEVVVTTSQGAPLSPNSTADNPATTSSSMQQDTSLAAKQATLPGGGVSGGTAAQAGCCPHMHEGGPPTAEDPTPGDSGALQAPPAAAAATAAAPAPAAAAGAAGACVDVIEVCVSPGDGGDSPPDVPRLTAWRDQLEQRLTAAGQQLQHMAPWQPAAQQQDDDDLGTGADTKQQKQQQQRDPGNKQKQQQQQQQTASNGSATLKGSSSSSNWLLRTADTRAPRHFSGSLAALWPLTPITGLNRPHHSSSRGGSSSSSTPSWLVDAAWPGAELSWLLHNPPAHLPSVDQLLWSALVQPVKARVDLVGCRLMSSLMGEWGMMQQLQGLINVFLIASPAIVEWADATFDALEAAPANKVVKDTAGSGSTPPAVSRTMSRINPGSPAVTAAAASSQSGARGVSGGVLSVVCGEPAVGVDDLDFMALEDRLQDCVEYADPSEVLPDPSSLILTYDQDGLAALRADRLKAQETRRAAQAGGSTAAAATGFGSVIPMRPHTAGSPGISSRKEVLPAVVTGGLMVCSSEWLALDLRHAGSWQLSLVYTDEQLRHFSKVWRLMLQLRWVRHRVDHARLMACKGGATVNDLHARDRREAEQVAAAAAYSGRGWGQQGGATRGSSSSSSSSSSFAHQQGLGAAAAGGVLDWLSGREELLLLQDMGHFMAQWHSYVLAGIVSKGWAELEKVLVSAKSLDQVHAATRSFLNTVCSLCNLQTPGASPSPLRQGMRNRFDALMDVALGAAAAAGRVQAARQKLVTLQAAHDRDADVQTWWLELGQARSRLQQTGRQWHAELHTLLSSWALLRKRSVQHVFDELQATLDMNGYFSRLAGPA